MRKIGVAPRGATLQEEKETELALAFSFAGVGMVTAKSSGGN
jgi:hypothetical protein